MRPSLFTPNLSRLGFGLFMAVNAASAWGGAFPLLPATFQTFDVMAAFSMAHTASLWATLISAMALSYLAPELLRHQTSVLCGPVMCLGGVCLIAPLYLPPATIPLVVAGGVMLGAGSGLFLLSWQRLFASQEPERGTLDLVVGMGYSAPMYVALHMIPDAVAAITIPCIFVPLAEVCLIEASKGIDFGQPMFADEPKAHAPVYRHSLKAVWRSAVCVGAFGFASGIARGVALDDPAMGAIVNYASMAGALVSAVALILLWRRRTFRFDTALSFRTLFPAVVTALPLLPYASGHYLHGFAGVMYAFFSFAVMIMMAQCAQVSRDSGVSPTFEYGFFAGIVYAMQSGGFLTGYLSSSVFESEATRLATVALAATWVLAIAMYLVRGRFDPGHARAQAIEFIALKRERPVENGSMLANEEGVSQAKASEDSALGEPPPPKGLMHERPSGKTPVAGDPMPARCAALASRYFLTSREAEVVELIASGCSAPRIAEMLVISENTVKTHSKRIYAKLGIHKRKELMQLLEEIEV